MRSEDEHWSGDDSAKVSRPRCERCGSRSWVQIVYGYAGPEAVQAAEADEVVLGGCFIAPDSAPVECRVCRHRPGTQFDWTGRKGPLGGEFAEFWRALDETSVPVVDAGDADLIDFALGFDAYEALGAGTVRSIGRRSRQRFERSGSLPKNLVILRTCLFFEQRATRFTGGTLDSPYVRALVAAIANHVPREQS